MTSPGDFISILRDGIECREPSSNPDIRSLVDRIRAHHLGYLPVEARAILALLLLWSTRAVRARIFRAIA